jgi:hypothetical protein
MRPVHHHQIHHHLHPPHTDAAPAAQLTALGLGAAIAVVGAPVTAIVLAGAGSIAGAAWLANRVRSRGNEIAVPDAWGPLLHSSESLFSSGLAVESSESEEGLSSLWSDD